MANMFDFGNANEEQRKAIERTEGPVLIIAGPGTGKTFTLVKRVVYLIAEKGVPPKSILVTTFTEKAAKELVTRISGELLALGKNVSLSELYVGTIHSVCLRLIKENIEFTRLKKNYRQLDDFDQKYMVYQSLRDFDKIENISLVSDIKGARWRRAGELAFYFNAVSEELLSADDLRKDPDPAVQALAGCYELYQSLLAKENAMDFSSIQVIAHNLLKENEAARSKVQEQIRYVMVDEYQDTNYVQEQLLFMIAARHRNICVVGDDDQGLYRFRGATIRNILEFPAKWEGCAQYTLDKNYRSEKGIVDFYNQWMEDTEPGGFEWGKFRYAKTIKAAKPGQAEGAPSVAKVSGQKELGNWGERVLSFILKLKESGTVSDFNQIAFLFRSVKGEGVKALADFLEARGVPVYSPRSNMFFEREEIMLLIAALLIAFPDYCATLMEESGAPENMVEYYAQCLALFGERVKSASPLARWCAKKGAEHSSKASFDYAFTGLVYEALQFEPFLSIMDCDISGVSDSRAIRNIAEFTKLTARYEYLHNINVFTKKWINKDAKRFFGRYLRFLYEGGIGEYEDDSEYAPSGCVSFMTVHQAKGMEFPVVVAGSLYSMQGSRSNEVVREMEENVYPQKPFEPYEDIKRYDFWRLYYTAFSRAQSLLVLTANENGKKEPSKYFANLYDALPDWRDIDYSKIRCAPVKDVNIKRSYSFTSHISVYENCPLQYKFFKDLGLIPAREGAAVFGNIVHATIEDIHRAAIRGEAEAITEENVGAWFSENYEAISRQARSYLSDQARAAALREVLRYAERQAGLWERIKDCEVDVSCAEDGFILNGRVDLIEGKDGALDIVDFKAERKPDMERDKERIARHKRQLQVYAYIIEQNTGQRVDRLRVYYTGASEDGVPEIAFRNDHAAVQDTIEEFARVVRKIEKRDYSKRSQSLKLCKSCDMRYFCRAKSRG